MQLERFMRKVAGGVLRPMGLYNGARDLWFKSHYYTSVLRRRRGAPNAVANQRAFLKQQTTIPMPPVHVSIEPTNICDMGCSVCETGAGIMARPKGYINLESFRIIVDKIAPHTNILFFYFMGEPFLNKEAFAMIRYAKDQGIPFITTCTNGHFADPVKLIECGIDEVNFQIGGITQETHEIYRVRGRLKDELDNCRATIAAREKNGGKGPKVVLGLIVMKHNEHEVSDFQALAAEMGVDHAEIVYPTVRTVAQGHQYLTRNDQYWIFDRSAFRQGVLKPKELPVNGCSWIYHSMIVTWNGDVVPCCRDTQGRFIMGNLIEQSMEDVWNGEKYREFRERIFDNHGGVSICKFCSGYGVPRLHS